MSGGNDKESPTHSNTKSAFSEIISLVQYLSPVPVDNPVHNRFLVTESQSQINRLPFPGHFLTTLAIKRRLRENVAETNSRTRP
jgi:hypothetical protein